MKEIQKLVCVAISQTWGWEVIGVAGVKGEGRGEEERRM